MLKKINDFLSGVPATLAGGIFLVLSFVVSRTEGSLPIDPAWVTVIISGIPLLYLAVWRLLYNPGISKISSALLITIAMIAAIFIGDLFAAGEVAFIMAIGAILEDMTTNRAKKGLKKLLRLAPTQGRRITDGKETMLPTEEICKGDILRILKEIDKAENRESIGAGIQKLLEVLGNYGNADRTYLFETVHTPEIFTNTYEWCADGITAQRDNLQYVKFEE